MPDPMLILLGIFLAGTIAAAIEYYRQLRRAQKEYEKARRAVEDIVLSFNKQFRHQAQKLEVLAYKSEATASKNDGILNRVEETAKRVATLEGKLTSGVDDQQRINMKFADVEKKLGDAMTSQQSVVAKIAELEEQARELRTFPEANLESVIPIKREKALAQLTETELSVLEMLVSEGAKTAPEIKERVKLSREHTARLMKKLYQEGYLERETSKIPFKYSVKKEMERLLRRTEKQAA